MKVVFCLPGRSFSNSFLQSWTNLLQYLPKYGIEPILSNEYDSVVYYVRNKCLGGSSIRGVNQKPFNGKLEYDYLMWIDSDMVFTVNDFIGLLNMNKDIASGIYKTSDNHHYATVEKWDKSYYTKFGAFQFLSDELINERIEPFEVDYTGLGWMLVKRGVFESLQFPWFRPEWEDFGNGIKEFTSEDVGFCKNIKKQGFKIFVNPNIKIGHEKSCIL